MVRIIRDTIIPPKVSIEIFGLSKEETEKIKEKIKTAFNRIGTIKEFWDEVRINSYSVDIIPVEDLDGNPAPFIRIVAGSSGQNNRNEKIMDSLKEELGMYVEYIRTDLSTIAIPANKK